MKAAIPVLKQKSFSLSFYHDNTDYVYVVCIIHDFTKGEGE